MAPSELLVKHQALDLFLGQVETTLVRTDDYGRRIQMLMEPFRNLLMENFMPEEFKQDVPGMFAQYLLYRGDTREISLMAMVVPSKIATPVHNHLAWGLVGVYQGKQMERVYRRTDDGSVDGTAKLKRVAQNRLAAGDITHLLPPDDDIHMIETTSTESSISIHLLGNDIGCQTRFAFDPDHNTISEFTSGYVNAECD